MNNRVKALCAVVIITGIIIGICGRETEVQDRGEQSPGEGRKTITVGFSQVGAESDWRTANSISIKETFCEENGYDLIFDDAKQKQENQIKAVRSFIQQEVDYIVLAPVVETGWTTVLGEAKAAGIPVIIIDRMISAGDEDLYTTWIGPDFRLEGRKVCAWLKSYADKKGISKLNIVHIQGTQGASAQIGRSQALKEACGMYGWNVLARESGEFTQAKAQEVMENLLGQYDDIDVVYCENDNEAFGVIAAIEKAGMQAGEDGDIMVVSFDAAREGLRGVLDGKIAVDAECDPLLGPKVEKVIRQLEEGEEPDKNIYVPERIFAHSNMISSIQAEGTEYEVEQVTQQMIEERTY